MKESNGGGQAFPTPGHEFIERSHGKQLLTEYHPGMTLRQWYVGQIVSGIARDLMMGFLDDAIPQDEDGAPLRCQWAADQCAAFADALVAIGKGGD